MDIWSWVHRVEQELRAAGNMRLAELVDNLSHVVCAGRHDQVDAMVPEALALARSAKAPWLEVFIRHWHLQSKIFHRHQVHNSLPEAVRLLEFANREDTRDCPQSVCVTQDLAKCYGRMDGPGYVEERLSVASETLTRINPSWPCFRCISAEYANALLDARRFGDVIEFVDAQRAEMAKANEPEPGEKLNWSRAAALLALEREQEALVEITNWDVELSGASTQQEKNLTIALALLRLDRIDEVAPLLPSVDEVLEIGSNYMEWARCMRELCIRDVADNDWQLGRDLWVMHRRLAADGAAYEAANLAKIGLELTIARGAKAAARMCLREVEDLQKTLRAPDHLASRVADLADKIKRMPDREVPEYVDPDKFFLALDDNPERALDQLAVGGYRWPDSERVARVSARALRVIGHVRNAEHVLREFLSREPESQGAFLDLADTLLEARDHTGLMELFDALPPPLPPYALWCRARSEHMRHELDHCVDTLNELIEAHPEPGQAHVMLAEIERTRGNWDRALELLDALVESSEPGDHDWDRMVAATVVGAWAKVRASSARLGLKLHGSDGPIDMRGELCAIKIKGEWRDQTLYAQRTGPVTARILSMGRIGHPTHFRDVVVFDPMPLNPADDDDDDDDDDDTPQTFAAVHTLERGGLELYSLDGARPGVDDWDDMVDAIRAAGGDARIVSQDDYVVQLGDSEPISAIYALVALPADMTIQDKHELLLEVTEPLEHPMVWIEIAEALDDEDEVTRQQEIMERYGLA